MVRYGIEYLTFLLNVLVDVSRTRWVDWRFTVVSMLVVLLLVLPFYQCYRTLAAYRVCRPLSVSINIEQLWLTICLWCRGIC